MSKGNATFEIKNTIVSKEFILNSIRASGNPMNVKIDTFDDIEGKGEKEYNDDALAYVNEKRMKLVKNLAKTPVGEGHDQFLTGCIVQFDLYAPLYMWKEIQRYHFLDFVSSQSTMHRLARFDVSNNCNSDVDEEILARFNKLLEEYRYQENRLKDMEEGKEKEICTEINKKLWRRLVASLPCGFILGATMTTNYRQLKTIYQQREGHKLKEWSEFRKWIETLPYSELITSSSKNKKKVEEKKK